MNGLDWLVLHERWVKAMCYRTCQKRRELMDDAWGVCVDYAQIVMNTHDIAKGDIDKHMRVGLRWYVFKWVRYKRPKQIRELVPEVFPEHSTVVHRNESDLADEDQVAQLMDVLDERTAGIVRMYVVDGFTFAEIGDYLGVSKNTVRKRYYHAIGVLRDSGSF